MSNKGPCIGDKVVLLRRRPLTDTLAMGISYGSVGVVVRVHQVMGSFSPLLVVCFGEKTVPVNSLDVRRATSLDIRRATKKDFQS